jgi:hypothetical protein
MGKVHFGKDGKEKAQVTGDDSNLSVRIELTTATFIVPYSSFITSAVQYDIMEFPIDRSSGESESKVFFFVLQCLLGESVRSQRSGFAQLKHVCNNIPMTSEVNAVRITVNEEFHLKEMYFLEFKAVAKG